MLLLLVLALVLIAGSTAWSSLTAHAQSVVISRSEVFIVADALTDPAGGGAGAPSPGQAVNPLFNPLVVTAHQTTRDHEITIDIPDMDPTSSGPRAGIQEGIAAGASVTVVFNQGVGIRNPTESGAIFVEVITSPSGSQAANVGLTVNPDTPGAEAEYRVTFTAPENLDANSTSITIVLDEDVLLPGVPPASNGDPSGADLSVVRSGLPATIEAGANLRYDLRVSNSGPDQATGVTVTETLPPGSALILVDQRQGSCRASDGTLTCDLGELGAGLELVISIELDLNASATGDFPLSASITGIVPDPTTDNNQSTGVLSVTSAPGATLPSSPMPTPTATTPPFITPSTPTIAPGPTEAPTQPINSTPAPTPSPTATPTLEPTPTDIPTLVPAPPEDSDSSEAPPQDQPSGEMCSSSLGNAPLVAGSANLFFLLAPLAGIWAYRWRHRR